MTNKNQTQAADDYSAYAYAAVAQQILNSNERSEVKQLKGGIALEKLVLNKFGEDAKGLLEGVMQSEKGMKIAADDYAGQYMENKFSKKTVADLRQEYSSVIDTYAGEKKEEINAMLDKFNEETYESIQKKVQSAQYKLQGHKIGETSEEDAKKAQEILKEYSLPYELISLAMENDVKPLREEIDKEFTQKTIQSYATSDEKQVA